MNKTPLYIHPIVAPNIPFAQMHFWDTSVEQFDNGQYLESLTHLINYVNKKILGKKKLTRGSKFSHPHGSSIIHLEITDTHIILTAPFLTAKKANLVALYRKITEINFHPLTMARIKLQHELLWFEYKTKIELCQPNKIYDVLREICVFSDDFDDAFIQKYNADFYHDPIIENYKPEHDLQIYNDILAYINDCLIIIQGFEKERQTGLIWSMIITTFFKIVDIPGVQGTLRTELEDRILFLQKTDKIPIEDRVAKSKNYLKKLQSQTFEVMSKNFYDCDYFISTKFRSSLPIIQQFLKPYIPQKNNELNQLNYRGAFFTIYYAFLALIFDYNIDKEHFSIITNALEKSSQVSWEMGSRILDNLLNKFITGNIGVGTISTKGFFAKLFRN